MRYVVCVLLFWALALGVVWASDFETIQGDWKLILGVDNGKPLTGAALEARLKVEGNRFSVDGASWPITAGTFEMKEGEHPKAIDLKGEDGKTALGIYEV